MCGEALLAIRVMVNKMVLKVRSRTPLIATLPLCRSAPGSQYSLMYSLIDKPPPQPPVKVTRAPRQDTLSRSKCLRCPKRAHELPHGILVGPHPTFEPNIPTVSVGLSCPGS
jgi:hypothetical protein